ncbi:GspH/FimT family pseudopilin [Salinisphaera sp.]|uniref:GspH/FimT family pseudopilin n=1 Tax=Salinisphaera sp. TaxID=1914330 RepID=UPI000C5D1116|nr:GspH/FimT family pseudopilin [Salinisphaera sp.]MAS09307.1 pilus assembly protein [Salinisphaera sp.]|tara:strand:- start:6657 stop:7199 length:543 start_codon:yes stop_codon:yes gene_type:complete
MGDYSHIAEIRATRGFSLLELLVTIAVAAILLAVAIPSYRSVVQRNAMAATVNDLVGDLNYARSQAVTRGQRVFMCKSGGNSTCNADGDWSQGWLVYAPDPGTTTPTRANTLRVRGALEGQITISGNNNITSEVFFDPNGFAMGSIGTFTAQGESVTRRTEVVISSTGRIRTEQTAKTES